MISSTGAAVLASSSTGAAVLASSSTGAAVLASYVRGPGCDLEVLLNWLEVSIQKL